MARRSEGEKDKGSEVEETHRKELTEKDNKRRKKNTDIDKRRETSESQSARVSIGKKVVKGKTGKHEGRLRRKNKHNRKQ